MKNRVVLATRFFYHYTGLLPISSKLHHAIYPGKTLERTVKNLLKWILAITLSLVVLAAIGIGLLLFAVDPNGLKPRIEQLARDQGVTLQIRGDLNWQLLPSIAIALGETRLSGNRLPDVQFQRAELALDWGKLIGGDIAINRVAINEPSIRLEMSNANAARQAAAIAAAPVAAQGTEQGAISQADGAAMALAIRSLVVQNGTLELLQDGALRQRIHNLNITGQQLNLDRQPFPLSLELTTSLADIAEQVTIRFTADINANQALQQFSATGGSLYIDMASSSYGDHRVSASFSATADLLANTLELPSATIQLDGIPLQLTARITSLTDTPNIQGTLDIPGFAPQPLLAAFKLDPATVPIKQLALKTTVSSQGNHHQLSDLTLTADHFTLTGTVEATLAQRREINATLNGTALNLDQYLPAGDQSPGSQQPGALFAPLLAPLAALNGGKGQVEISLAQLTVQGIQLDQLHINSFGNGSVIRIADASANGFGGTLRSDARIDLGAAAPRLTVNLAAKSVDMGQALTALVDFKELSGHGDLTFKGTTGGHSRDEMLANLTGTGNFQLTEPVYSALNIERQFCTVIGDKDQQPESWPKGSRFNNAAGTFTLNGQNLSFQRLNTGVGNLKLRGTGGLALLDKLMDTTLVFNISDAKSSEQGCVLRSKSIQNRDIPLRLRGSIDNMSEMIQQALVELIARTVIENRANKLLDKLLNTDDDQQDTDNDRPKDSKDQVKDLLKNLLKKR